MLLLLHRCHVIVIELLLWVLIVVRCVRLHEVLVCLVWISLILILGLNDIWLRLSLFIKIEFLSIRIHLRFGFLLLVTCWLIPRHKIFFIIIRRHLGSICVCGLFILRNKGLSVWVQ